MADAMKALVETCVNGKEELTVEERNLLVCVAVECVSAQIYAVCRLQKRRRIKTRLVAYC